MAIIDAGISAFAMRNAGFAAISRSISKIVSSLVADIVMPLWLANWQDRF